MVVVSDQNVGPRYGENLRASLRSAGYSASLHLLPSGEQFKTMESVASLWEGFTQARLERASTVVALGGGVIGDLAGFAAATYLRGISWVAAPTSLLAMVDASLGGKTGFDLPAGKNLVGAFYPPRLVLADPDVLTTLPEEELRSGMAEVVKHGILADPSLFQSCRREWDEIMADLDTIVRRAMAVKVRYIQSDPYEQGSRTRSTWGTRSVMPSSMLPATSSAMGKPFRSVWWQPGASQSSSGSPSQVLRMKFDRCWKTWICLPRSPQTWTGKPSVGRLGWIKSAPAERWASCCRCGWGRSKPALRWVRRWMSC